MSVTLPAIEDEQVRFLTNEVKMHVPMYPLQDDVSIPAIYVAPDQDILEKSVVFDPGIIR